MVGLFLYYSFDLRDLLEILSKGLSLLSLQYLERSILEYLYLHNYLCIVVYITMDTVFI